MAFSYADFEYKLTWDGVRYPLPFDCIITPRTPNAEGLICDLEMD